MFNSVFVLVIALPLAKALYPYRSTAGKKKNICESKVTRQVRL